MQVLAGVLHGALPVAIKVLYSAGTAQLSRQFWSEAAILQGCRHTNIVQMYGVFSGLDDSICTHGAVGAMGRALTQGEKRLMVVMELLEGGTLQQHINQPEMRWNKRCALSAGSVHMCAQLCVFYTARFPSHQVNPLGMLQGRPCSAGCSAGAGLPPRRDGGGAL